LIARFDTLDPRGVTQAASWQTFDLTTAVAGACGYQGAMTDGSYLYLVPANNGSASSPFVPPFLRYDTTQALTDSSAWAAMTGTSTTPTTLNLQSAFAASDGVYGYLGPNWHPGAAPSLGSASGGFFRWRIWPGPKDAQAGRLGQSLNFWLDSSGKVGFGTKQPAEQIHATANVRADGLLLALMGASTQTAQAQTTPFVSASEILVGSSAPYTLASYALPANALSAINKGVRIHAFGAYLTTSTTDPMYLLLKFGSATMLTGPKINAAGSGTPAGSWYLDGTALLSSTNPASEACGAMLVSTPPGNGMPISATSFVVATQDPTQAITIAVQGSSASTGDINLDGLSVDFIN
jgi:hypothetical protein